MVWHCLSSRTLKIFFNNSKPVFTVIFWNRCSFSILRIQPIRTSHTVSFFDSLQSPCNISAAAMEKIQTVEKQYPVAHWNDATSREFPNFLSDLSCYSFQFTCMLINVSCTTSVKHDTAVHKNLNAKSLQSLQKLNIYTNTISKRF